MKENSQIPILGTPQAMKDGSYFIKNKAVIGKVYQLVCPECKSAFLVKALSTKAHKGTCKKCGKAIFYIGKDESVEEVGQEQAENIPTQKYKMRSRMNQTAADGGKSDKANAKLVWGGFFNRNTFVFDKPGEFYIGRDDDTVKSDIIIKDDYVSRRSLCMEVITKPDSNDYSYKLTVRNATNPVLINGQEMASGESVYLNYGDTILVGNTILTFKRCEKR